MILKRGITSFFNWDDRGPIPKFGVAEFKSIVYAVATPLGYAVQGVSERGVTPNFHSALLTNGDTPISILGHSTYPIFAFSEPLDLHSCEIRFVDSAPLTQQLVALFPNVAVATTAELVRNLTDIDLESLDAAEREQVKYWQPKTVGNAAFNWWD
jgi:hypothetical protein